MFTSICPLIIVHLFAVLWVATLFLPAKSIRWGGLWYFQILVTEWLFLSWVVAVALISYSATLLWFPGAILIYIYNSNFTLLGGSTEAYRETQTCRILNSVTFNVWPFKRPPLAQTLELENSDLKHLAFAPTGTSSNKKVCLHIHGGAWIHGDPSQLNAIVHLFLGHEYQVISLNYRKYPGCHLDEIIAQLEQSFLSLTAQYPEDTQFVTYGRSAGGHMALMLAARYPHKINQVVALYPVTDFESLDRDGRDNDILRTKSWIRSITGKMSDDQRALIWNRNSPLKNLPANRAEVLIVHGENDPVVPVQQSQILYDKLSSEGSSIQFLKFKYATHGFDAIWTGASMRIFKKVLSDFIKK